MILSDAELKAWWDGLPKSDRLEILGTMIDRASNDWFRSFAEGLVRQLQAGKPFSPKQLAQIRKWAP